jgi:hypothetical protein
MTEETTSKPLTIRERLLAQATELAHQKAASFNLATQFGFSEDEIYPLEISGRKVPFSTRGVVRTNLDDLTEDIRSFLEAELPSIIFNQLLDQYLNQETPE